MRWLLLIPRGEDVFAKHVKFLLMRERKDVNSGWVELVVGNVDQPGAEEKSPTNSQHDMDIQRSQIMGIAVDILDSHSFSYIESSLNGQTENIIMITSVFIGIFVILNSYTRNMMKNIKKYMI